MSNELVHYEAARCELQLCTNVGTAKEIADKAAALQRYARLANDPVMEAWVAEIRLRARVRIGELSKALEAAPGTRTDKPRPSAGTRSVKRETLAAAGIAKSEAHRCEKIAGVVEQDPAAFERVLVETKDAGRAVTADEIMRSLVKQARKADVAVKAEAVAERADNLEALLAAGLQFGCILADPPWLYENQGTRGATGDHYSGMSLDELVALPVARLAAKNAHLHLWTTNAFLFESERVIRAWGFEPRSCYVWVKPQLGMGNYWRVSHELLLLGVRGSCPFADHSLRSWGEFPRAAHSQKPEQVRALIERASPGPRLELFGRRFAPGWVVWGNEVEGTLFDAAAQEAAA